MISSLPIMKMLLETQPGAPMSQTHKPTPKTEIEREYRRNNGVDHDPTRMWSQYGHPRAVPSVEG